jgi:hypothetical protein
MRRVTAVVVAMRIYSGIEDCGKSGVQLPACRSARSWLAPPAVDMFL